MRLQGILGRKLCAHHCLFLGSVRDRRPYDRHRSRRIEIPLYFLAHDQGAATTLATPYRRQKLDSELVSAQGVSCLTYGATTNSESEAPVRHMSTAVGGPPVEPLAHRALA